MRETKLLEVAPRSTGHGSRLVVRRETREPSKVSGRGVGLGKRAFDLICILSAAPLLILVAALVALLIWMVSPGSILFRQRRIGYLGRPFTCLKFRTMKIGADSGVHQRYCDHLIEADLPMTKMDQTGDERLIPFGFWLRSTGLDELPQLINVLRGEMSLVGPRPCLPYEYEKYQPWHRQRCETLPGLTGLWQVSGKNRTTFEEMMRLDVFYARTNSLELDIRILLKTVPVLFGQVHEVRKFRPGSGRRAAGADLSRL